LSGKRILLYVQHLLGIGHLKRAATLAAALGDAGCEVTFVTGGYPVPGVVPPNAHVVQLPAAGAADLDFRSLLDAHGAPVDESWRTRRREQLLEAFGAARPHALIIELFPFGRRQMRFELLPLLDAAHAASPRPLIVSSVRDVLGQRDPAKQDEMLALFERYFDHALVHGDPRFLDFGQTFRHGAKLGERLHHTGFIVDRSASPGLPGDAGAGEVLVSAGGGAVGARLLETAIRARPLTNLSSRRWRLLSGVNLDAAKFAERLDMTAMQRQLKAIGIFSRLELRDARPSHLVDIEPVLAHLGDVARAYPDFERFGDWLAGTIRPAARSALSARGIECAE